MAVDPNAPAVLVVEDSDEDFDTLHEAAGQSRWPCALLRCRDGGSGLDLLRGPPALRPALVLLDLNTPGTDGREALTILKSQPSTRGIPVVVFSTSANPRDIEFCYACGANAYHVKPVQHPAHRAMLLGLLDYWLGLVQPGGPVSRAV